ncbi:MAG: glycine--tRNA ligase subunit beta, partial [Myxococcales bacterium]
MAKDLLLEIGCEEIPASFVRPALAEMAGKFSEKAKEARLGFGELRTYGTPRRLTLLVQGVAEAQEDLFTEVQGPLVKVAYDAEGKPTAIAEKWAAGQGVDVSALKKKETPKGQYVCVEKHEKGQKAEKVLPDVLLAVIKGIGFKKSMRWGWEEESFARPVQWIVALHGNKVVKLQFADVKSGNTTRGHRFLSKKPIKIEEPAAYVELLREGHVVVDQELRKQLVKQEVEQQAREVGGAVLEDEELLETVTFLVESPTGVWGGFDREFLDLPPEVLVSEARGHQKYFSVKAADGRLMPNFVAVSNTPVKDKAVSRAGYERVLRARLSDARFFFTEDQKRPLASRVDELKRVVFQEKLGTSYEKMERFRALAIWLAAHLGLGAP